VDRVCRSDGFRVDTYNYSDPKDIAKWTNITDEYPTFNIVGEVWMQQFTNGVLAKDSPIGKIQNYNSQLPK
jgi:hypothetical protein